MRRTVLSVVVGILCVVLMSGTTLADTEKGHTGKVGDHQLNDYADNWIMCHYVDPDNGDALLSIDVHTVTMWARDTSPARNTGQVGWQMVLLRKKPNASAFKFFWKSAVMKAQAWDDTSAFFPTRHISMKFPYDTSTYVLRAKMYWYKHGNVIGTALHQYDFYRLNNGTQTIDASSCPGRFPA